MAARKRRRTWWILLAVVLLTIWLVQHFASPVDPVTPPRSASAGQDDNTAVSAQLLALTDVADPGPTRNYYWNNGRAQINQADMPPDGQVVFTTDTIGRSATARATLTYQMWLDAKGKYPSTPLTPPAGAWPAANPKVKITNTLQNPKTGQPYIYNGDMWNRSHSIGNSLAGAVTFTNPTNFTAGTRCQNVGANQNGGMRAPEEIAENYWKTHTNTTTTIWYQTTPVYSGSELIPRGSIVDILSSDNTIDAEIVVINDAEGWTINYNTGDTTPQ